jgi:uncharacterized membrane-anchored protein YjiN (DUF445 family)
MEVTIEKTPLVREFRVLREEIAEKDRHIQEQNGVIEEMKKRTQRWIQLMNEEFEKTTLMGKVEDLKEELMKKDRQIQEQSGIVIQMKQLALREIESVRKEFEREFRALKEDISERTATDREKRNNFNIQEKMVTAVKL